MTKSFIVLKNAWPGNIGNAFVDIGSMLLLQKAMKTVDKIHIVSAYPTRLFAVGPATIRTEVGKLVSKASPRLKKALGRHFETVRKEYLRQTKWKLSRTASNAFNLAGAIKSDYLAVSGRWLTVMSLTWFRRVFDEAKEKGVKIIFLGAGGFYSSDEIAEVRRLLKEIQPSILISRDEVAFENYHDLAQYSYNGIDLGFFVDDLPMLQDIEVELGEYVTFCFDRIPEPRIEFEREPLIIRTSHFFEETPRQCFHKPNMLVSDSPIDYLILYKHTKETYSDRNHACVATLSFGKPSRLYQDDPSWVSSTLLFNKVGADTITSDFTYPDTHRIQIEKERQVRFLSEVLR